MNSADIIELLSKKYTKNEIRIVVNSSNAAIVLCHTPKEYQLYFACCDVEDNLYYEESFSVYDGAKLDALYSKEKDILLIRETTHFRKVMIEIMVKEGLVTASQVRYALSKKNLLCGDEYFLKIEDTVKTLDYLFNVPLNRKPTFEEQIISADEIKRGHIEVHRGDGSSKQYIIRKFEGSKAEKKKTQNIWYQLGYEIEEL